MRVLAINYSLQIQILWWQVIFSRTGIDYWLCRNYFCNNHLRDGTQGHERQRRQSARRRGAGPESKPGQVREGLPSDVARMEKLPNVVGRWQKGHNDSRQDDADRLEVPAPEVFAVLFL